MPCDPIRSPYGVTSGSPEIPNRRAAVVANTRHSASVVTPGARGMLKVIRGVASGDS
jgi:hypothetical protein